MALVYRSAPDTPAWTLTASREGEGQQTLQLRQDIPQNLQHWTAQLGTERLQVLTGDSHLLLRREQAGSRALALAAGRARLGSYLVQPTQAFAAMRLARAAALALRGQELAIHNYAPENSRKYLVTPPHALGQLAERGIEVLLTLSSRVSRQELLETLQQTATAIGLEAAEGLLLAELLLNPLPELLLGSHAVEQAGFTRTGPFTVLEQPNQGQGWQLAAGKITAHIQPTASAAPFAVSVAEHTIPLEEQLILPLEEGILLLAQHGGIVAASVAPKLSDTDAI